MARGIAIISIILGHLGVPWINRIVFTFHVPIFFLIAGIFYKKHSSVNEVIKKRLKTLIVPYISTCAGIALSDIAFNNLVRDGKGDKQILLYWIKAALYGAGTAMDNPKNIPIIGAIWFLLALFWASLIIHFIIKLNNSTAMVFVVTIVALSCFTARYYWLPLSIQAGCVGTLYVYIGYLWKDYFKLEKKLPKKTTIAIVLVAIIIWIIFVKHFTYFRIVCCKFDKWYDLIRSLAACIAVLAISVFISEKLRAATRILSFTGRYSIVILCLHIIELNTFPYRELLTAFGIPEGGTPYQLMRIVIKLIICVCGTCIILKFPRLRRLFGL